MNSYFWNTRSRIQPVQSDGPYDLSSTRCTGRADKPAVETTADASCVNFENNFQMSKRHAADNKDAMEADIQQTLETAYFQTITNRKEKIRKYWIDAVKSVHLNKHITS